jgi:type III pantothenate kinase
MILAVDAGNTRIKWGLHDGSQWLRRGSVGTREMEALAAALAALQPPTKIIVSNVAGPEAGQALEGMLEMSGGQVHWLRASASLCGVTNCYDDPARLGSDRWAALIGAWNSQREGCIVVNAGTAVTIDALTDDGVFLGGLIVPGISAMAEALVARTAGLDWRQGMVRPFPTNSADGMQTGILSALAGAVSRMVAELGARLGREPACVLSGGDAPLVQPLLGGRAVMVDNLVLEGLIRIASA